MSESATLLALPQLIDLSLNCHEGVINFQALHTLLHVVVQQLALNEVGVEFRGVASDKIQNVIKLASPSEPQVFPEYSILPPKGGKRKSASISTPKKLSLKDVLKKRDEHEERREKELRVIEKRKNSKEDPDPNPLPLKSPTGSLVLGPPTPADIHTVVLIESGSGLPQQTVAVSKSHFDEIENNVEVLKKEVQALTDLPANLNLIESSKASSSGPIVDMFSILKLTKRVDAAEAALEKMGSLFEDLVKDSPDADELSKKVKAVQGDLKDQESVRRGSVSSGVNERLTKLEKQMEELIQNGSVGKGEPGERASTKFTSRVQDVELSDIPPQDAFKIIQEEFENLKQWVTASLEEVQGTRDTESSDTPRTGATIENKFKEYNKHIEQMNVHYNNKLNSLYDQFKGVQQDMSDIYTKLQLVLPGGDSTGINAETTMELANKLELLENELENIAQIAAKLQEQKEEQDKQTTAILEQIDLLKIVKANREDLEDALGEKADACMINRKVSHDQFDAACDDLNKGIEEALTRLREQEDMWHQALETIQKQVGNKLDKMEVDPLRDFVNSKLKALQEKFKTLTAFKREHEAAGTKSKILRNVNCISCDKDVVMKKEMDVTLKPKPYAMPPSRNMAPYLAYELDQLRKQQKCVPGSKNLNFIENALKTRGALGKDHICNRYCGGSHTVTTPQQRVTRLGHFLEQWGPEIAPLNDEYVRGNDKHMYKARDDNLYKNKASKDQGSAKGGNRVSSSAAVTDSKAPIDPNGQVNPAAQELIEKETHIEPEKDDTEGKKSHNIGSMQINPPSGSNQPVFDEEEPEIEMDL